jgi:hypothetical protein
VPRTRLSGGGIFMCAAVRYSSRSERQLHHSTRRLPAESLRSVVAKFAATYLPRSPTPGDYKTLLRFWYQSGRHVDYFRIESGRLSYFQVPNRVKQRATYRAHYSAGQSLPASPQASLQRLMALMAHIFPRTISRYGSAGYGLPTFSTHVPPRAALPVAPMDARMDERIQLG